MRILPLLGLLACGGSEPLEPTFASGFEGSLQLTEDDGEFADLLGVDAQTGNDWEGDLEGGAFGSFRFYFEAGTTEQRGVDLVNDPEDAENTVLFTHITEPGIVTGDSDEVACNGEGGGDRKGRVQAVLRDNPSLHAVDYTVRMRLGDGFRTLDETPAYTNHWLTVAEFWNNLPGEDYTFRISLGLHTETKGGGLSWVLKADRHAEGGTTWEYVWPGEVVSTAPVPLEEWFTLDVSLVEGDQDQGRAVVRLLTRDGSEHLIADVSDATHHPDDPAPDGFADINPMKLYTSGGILCGLVDRGVILDAWWDDFAIYAGGRSR